MNNELEILLMEQGNSEKGQEQLIERYLNNLLTPEEAEELAQLLDSQPQQSHELRESYNTASLLAANPQSGDTSKGYRSFRKWKKRRKKARQRVLVFQTLRYAAVLALILLVGYLYGEYRTTNELKQQLIEVEAPAGQRLLFTMKDGSTISLSPNSKLTFSASYGKEERSVALEGAAFFDVKENRSLPFTISTRKGFEVEVLGTQFYLQSDRLQALHLSLLEGKVSITHDKCADEKMHLLPGESVLLKEGRLKKSREELADIANHKLGIVQYRSATLEEVFGDIGHWYAVEIIFADSALQKRTLSGKIRQGDSLKSILEAIASSLHLSYEFLNDKTVRISE